MIRISGMVCAIVFLTIEMEPIENFYVFSFDDREEEQELLRGGRSR